MVWVFTYYQANIKTKKSRSYIYTKKNNIDCRPIVTGNFTKNEVMKFFDYDIHHELINADHLHENGFFVGNSQFCLENELRLLWKVLNK